MLFCLLRDTGSGVGNIGSTIFIVPYRGCFWKSRNANQISERRASYDTYLSFYKSGYPIPLRMEYFPTYQDSDENARDPVYVSIPN